MARSKSSKRWLQEHFSDEYVQKAQRDGVRSRAVYKLEEIDQKYHLVCPGMTVVDLGCAPGGWCEYALPKVGKKGAVFGLDILDMEPLKGVEFLQGDFREEKVLDEFLQLLGNRAVGLVLSDMAPNISGMKAVDQPRAMFLTELAVDFADRVLNEGGSLLVKVFQGEGFDALWRGLQTSYGSVTTCKPKASRGRSREVYILARNHKV